MRPTIDPLPPRRSFGSICRTHLTLQRDEQIVVRNAVTTAIASPAISLPAPAVAAPAPPPAAAPTAATPAGAPASLNGIPTTDPNGNSVVLTLPDGRQITVPLATALSLGMVVLDSTGKAQLTETGKAALAKLSSENPGTSAPAAGAAPAADATAGAAVGQPMPAQAQQPAAPTPGTPAPGTATAPAPNSEKLADEKPKPKMPSELLGKAASIAFMTRGILKVALGPGLPSWQTAYFALNGVNNNLANRKMLPDWYTKGPIADLLEWALVGGMTVDSMRVAPGEWAKYKTALTAEHAAGRHGVGAHFRSLMVHEKPPAEPPKPTPIQQGARDNTFVGKFSGLLTPLFNLGAGLSSVSSILGLTEYLNKNGTKGLGKTTTGRDGVLGALGGVAMLGAVFLPASPLASFMDLGSNLLWIAQIANGKGWFDGFLGGDPEEPKAPAPAT